MPEYHCNLLIFWFIYGLLLSLFYLSQLLFIYEDLYQRSQNINIHEYKNAYIFKNEIYHFIHLPKSILSYSE